MIAQDFYEKKVETTSINVLYALKILSWHLAFSMIPTDSELQDLCNWT